MSASSPFVPLALAAASFFAGARLLRAALARPVLLLEELALVLACAYPVGAAAWLWAWLEGTTLLGFGAPWTWLTAAHFFVAGAGALALTALVTRLVDARLGRRVMLVLVALHPVAFATVAAGLSGVAWADELGAPLYALLFAVQAIVYLFATPSRGHAVARVGLGVALLVPIATLVPAVGWAWRRPMLSLDDMVRFHGVANALGHVGLGLAMLAWLRPPRRVPALVAPLSRLRIDGRVSGGAIVGDGPPVRGLSDDLSRYARPGFDPGALPADTVAFYTDTASFELDLVGRWHGPFVVGGWLWARVVAPLLGQLGLPPPGRAADDAQLDSRIVAVDAARDGRAGARGWVRHWRTSNAVLYVAVYADHVTEGTRYMNIAFPLPGGWNMTSILRLDHAPGRGLALSSLPAPEGHGDQGVYLVRQGHPWRLPLDETITVYEASAAPSDLPAAPGSVLVARHEMWLAGLRYLTMHYQIRRRGAPPPLDAPVA